MIKTAKKVEA